uniref:Uncharacterized protein n=1 Tax=Ovis aries TaxID=9940 RepID=A0AC11BYG5_SHEEP
TLPGEHPCQDLAPGTQPFQSPFLSSVPALHLYQRILVPGSPVALLVRPGPRLCQPPVRPCSHPCLRPLGPRRCRPGAPRGPRRGRLHPVPERAPRSGARRLRPSLLPGVRGAILGGGRRALSVSRVCRRLLAARRGARPPAAQPPPAGARRSSCGAHARRPGLRGGAAAAVPRRRGPAVRSLPHGRGARATRVGAPLEEGAARQGALSRRVPCPCSHHQTAPCPPSVFSGWRPGPQSPSSGRCPGCPPHTPENKGSVEIMKKDLNDARDLHGQAESAAAVWKGHVMDRRKKALTDYKKLRAFFAEEEGRFLQEAEKEEGSLEDEDEDPAERFRSLLQAVSELERRHRNLGLNMLLQ